MQSTLANITALKLFEQYSINELYFKLSEMFEGDKGVGLEKQKAETYLTLISMIEVLWNGKVPHDNSLYAIYHCSDKKVNITLNEIVCNKEENGKCIASGTDQHFNNYADSHNYGIAKQDEFRKLLAYEMKDHLKWIANEFCGEIVQLFRGDEESVKAGINIGVELIEAGCDDFVRKFYKGKALRMIESEFAKRKVDI